MSGQDAIPDLSLKYASTLATSYLALVKTALLYDLKNEVFLRPISMLREVINRLLETSESVSICALGELIYVNRKLVRMDSGTYDQLKSVVRILDPLRAQEVTFCERVQDQDLYGLLAAIKESVGRPDGWQHLRTVAPPKVRVHEASQVGTKQVELSDRMRAVRTYIASLLTVKDMVLSIDERRELSLSMVKRSVQDLVSMVYARESLMLGMLTLRRYRGSTFNHLVNTAVLASALCHRIDTTRNQAVQVALSAVLHDLDWSGASDRTVTVRQLARLYREDRMGRLRIATAADLGRSDGLAASRLISVASAFDRLTAPEPLGSNLPSDEALRRLQAETGNVYDPTAVKLLVRTVGVYPIGSMVALSTGEAAIVVELPSDGRSSARPLVKVVREPTGAPADGRVVDLMTPGTPRIVGVLDPQRLDLNVTHFFLA